MIATDLSPRIAKVIASDLSEVSFQEVWLEHVRGEPPRWLAWTKSEGKSHACQEMDLDFGQGKATQAPIGPCSRKSQVIDLNLGSRKDNVFSFDRT